MDTYPSPKTYEGRPCKKGHTLRYTKGRNCVACINEAATKRQKSNPRAVSEAHRRWREKNPDKYRENYASWANTPEGRRLVRANNAKRRAARLQATPPWLTREEHEAIKQFYLNCPDGHEVDHIIPLQGGNICGLHVLSNLQYLTEFENRSKHNRWQE